MRDAFEEHLIKHGLLELHQEAQQVGYRVRTANWQVFEMEYEGRLEKYNVPGMWIRRYDETVQGIEEARAFLAEVQADIDQLGIAKKNVE